MVSTFEKCFVGLTYFVERQYLKNGYSDRFVFPAIDYANQLGGIS